MMDTFSYEHENNRPNILAIYMFLFLLNYVVVITCHTITFNSLKTSYSYGHVRIAYTSYSYGPIRIATAKSLFVHEYCAKFFIILLAMPNAFKVAIYILPKIYLA